VPFEQNPERALGVIFDHDAVQGQDTVSGTKLTVMLGGHWWQDWEEYPDSAEGAMYAKSVIERHLGIKDEPDLCHATLNRDCIPQYKVGYEDNLRFRAEQLSTEFRGRMRVVGSQYNGVGVNDCIRGAWQIANGMRGNGWKGQSTGLDRVMDDREWILGAWPRWKAPRVVKGDVH
jgi:oxygen-dependent protoporphyrinogen oxidase